jgi:hypothetical protein
MDRRDAMIWVVSVCTSLGLSQAKTLSVLVLAALAVERVSLASLGRSLGAGSGAKHAIKRCWRFIANDRVEPSVAMAGVVGRLLHKRRKPLVVALDWTDIRGLTTLMASAVVKGRSVPLVWASCPQNVWQGHKSRNSFEEALLLTLRAMIPRKVPVILLADRGFGRTELGRFCQNQGFHYVIRIQPKVEVCIGSQKVRLDLYPVRRGICQLLKGVLYRQHEPHPPECRGVLEEGAPQEARRVLVLDERPAPAGSPTGEALWEADADRRVLPRRQEQTQRLEPARHRPDAARAARPLDPDPGPGLPALGGPGPLRRRPLPQRAVGQ